MKPIIYSFIKNTYNYSKYNRLLKKIYKDEHIVENLSRQMNAEFKMDWVGRIYTVINPVVQGLQSDPVNGSSTIAYEFNADGTLNPDAYVRQWVLAQLSGARDFIRAQNLFELLTLSVEKIDDDQNYLIIFKNIWYDDWAKSFKAFGLLMGGLAVLLLAALIIL